jgi:hypothetical protein
MGISSLQLLVSRSLRRRRRARLAQGQMAITATRSPSTALLSTVKGQAMNIPTTTTNPSTPTDDRMAQHLRTLAD